MINFTFAGFNSYTDLHLITKNIQRESLALNPQEIEIPARTGSVYEGTKIGAKTITIDVLLMADNETQKAERLRNFNSFVAQTINNDNEFELKLDDEPNVTFWCHITNVSTPTRVVQRGADTEFSITFVCSEGVGVGEQQMQQITNSTHNFTNTGTADTFLNFNMIKVGGEPVNKVGVASSEDEFIYVGVEDETNTIPPSKRVLNETMNTLATSTKITTPSFVLENAIINPDTDIITTGKAMQIMSKDGRYFYGNAGSSVDTKKWRGAGRIWTLSQALTNSWKITARFYTQNNYARSKTKIELYLLNQAGIRIGRIMIKDGGISLQNDVLVEVGTDSVNNDVFWSQRDANRITKKEKDKSIKITAGSTKTAKTKSSSKKGDTVSVYQNVLENNSENLFTDFYGNITLLRYRNNDIWVYKVAVQRLDNNGTEKGSPYVTYFRDIEKKYDVVMNQVASFALYSAHMPILEDKSTTTATYKNNQMQLSDLRAWQINDGAKDEEFLVETGDEIVINGDNFSVTNNTVPVPHAIGSTFIKVKAGETVTIGVFPEPDAINHLWFVSWLNRYH